ncbi:MAG: divergent polysaccharide deacetylase family protein [Thermoanaerobaculia bacterium]
MVGLALFALGAYYGDRLLDRLEAWRAPVTRATAAAKEKRPAAPAAAKPVRPKPSSAPAAKPEKEIAAPPVSSVGTEAEPASGQPRARIALVIDDLGRDVAAVERLTTLAPLSANVQLSYAVLPFESRTSEVVEALRRHGAEVLLHLPMDPEGAADPGPGALLAGMSKRDLAAATAAALAAVPGAVGVNNHMGSKLSGDRTAMTAILGEVKSEGRYFLDSRTTAESVGFEVARDLGIPAASRDLFLDDEVTKVAITAQFAKLLALAREQGAAIAIAHPHPATLAVLAEAIPRAVADGFEFVPVSYLLERSEELPE